MASAPARTCGRPGCRGIVRDDVCSVCGPRKRGGWQDDAQRGTRHQRGYDAAWVAVRRQFIVAKTIEAAAAGAALFPICELCRQTVEKTREIHVDHVRPFRGLDDPLRLDPANLRITHYRCHMRATARARSTAAAGAVPPSPSSGGGGVGFPATCPGDRC
jgi:5-methylcytosine-specific restriction protein A